jgi:protein-disulfide isomerase
MVFSDPLCPFCKDFMTDAIEEGKKKPAKFGVYLYHFPLTSIHPQSPVLIRAMIAAEILGVKDVAYKVYSANMEFKTANVDEVLDAFNKAVGCKLTKEHLGNVKVEEHYKYDAKRAEELMIKGTPAVFIDGKLDPKREKFETYRKEGK